MLLFPHLRIDNFLLFFFRFFLAVSTLAKRIDISSSFSSNSGVILLTGFISSAFIIIFSHTLVSFSSLSESFTLWIKSDLDSTLWASP